jgi:hypothetical protein
LGYLICRRCGARIDLPHVKYADQVPPIFSATCPSCGRASVYSYVDLKDVKFMTMEEYLQRPEGRLAITIRILPDFLMFAHGIKQIQKSIAYTIEKMVEKLAELERRRQQPPETPNVS